ncbi:DeoR/GlpR family DNA-binding transcription regulator [Fictibacillus phosphorivorans]|uniref:DeoR/GlpR family DNA-binding transcription regulator n=1 Tax=Fictibacillus phosphorivorans TaxID=1221500 RepID=UPI002041F067|nr:DeoR/GlpR family DNA-binding transcription regulator [Fictibacillus phosphorivorans]MCM3717818.1 DeoR/GlpR family DNA-binding transcription regulator [Fictibacillus phosphorivorans]MCM3777046.1 DeoR/GlpR family DNA-binding transcription regulator [Fictibacillus phosphorivorans]
MPKERRNEILKQLNAKGKIDIEDLVRELNVSAMTVRRDLAYLEENNKIIRTHGGAILNKPLVVESSFASKEGKFNAQKKWIAQKAVELIQEHSTILLDSGTTTLEIAKLLKEKKTITVITNDIKIAAELIDSNVKVIVTGGELQNKVGTLFGPVTEQILKHIHVDLFFLGAHAIDVKAGVTAPTFEKASIKKLMIEASEKTWLVADSSKFDQKSLTKACDLQQISGVITDYSLTHDLKEKLSEYLDVVTVEGGE